MGILSSAIDLFHPSSELPLLILFILAIVLIGVKVHLRKHYHRHIADMKAHVKKKP